MNIAEQQTTVISNTCDLVNGKHSQYLITLQPLEIFQNTIYSHLSLEIIAVTRLAERLGYLMH